MNTREKVHTTIDFMSDDQLEGLYSFLKTVFPEDIYNEETLEAFKEADEMTAHPENYKGFTNVNDLFEELSR